MEPLKSTLSFAEVGETSLAMPSDGASHSGQRRVLEQVTTLRRSKSKYSSKGSMGTTSPTSPKNDIVFSDFKFSPTMANGSSFTYDSSMLNGLAKTQKYTIKQRSASTRSAAYQRDQRNALSSPTGQSLPAQPDFFVLPTINYQQTSTNYTQKSPDKYYIQNPLYSNGQVITSNNVQRNNSTNQISDTQFIHRQTFSTNSNPEPKLTINSRAKSKSEMNGFRISGESNSDDIKLSEAVGLLSVKDENLQLRGASIIQHSTFTSDKAKDEVRKLSGIAPLVSLLTSPSPTVQETAASALRNIVYKNMENKNAVSDAGGVKEALNLLKNSNSLQIQKHVTGLLWNLSSADAIHSDLLHQALPVLINTILKPYADQSPDPTGVVPSSESFCNAIGCIRNLSSNKQNFRKTIRKRDDLIESLFKHIESSIENRHASDQSVENCVGVMHNLTYQLEKEEPTMFTKLYEQEMASKSRYNSSDTGSIGCFSNQSHKIQQNIIPDFYKNQAISPKGKDILIHKQTVQSYLEVLRLSENSSTSEICIGALHNLTANKSTVSDMFSFYIVNLNGVETLKPLLESPNTKLKYSIYTLLGNLSRSPYLQRDLAHRALPGVLNILTSDIENGNCSAEADSAFAVGCHTVNKLLRAQPEKGTTMLSTDRINTLVQLSQNNSFPKASTAAGVLLQSLWSEKNFQNLFKKLGLRKELFVNETTSAALKSVQVIE